MNGADDDDYGDSQSGYLPTIRLAAPSRFDHRQCSTRQHAAVWQNPSPGASSNLPAGRDATAIELLGASPLDASTGACFIDFTTARLIFHSEPLLPLAY